MTSPTDSPIPLIPLGNVTALLRSPELTEAETTPRFKKLGDRRVTRESVQAAVTDVDLDGPIEPLQSRCELSTT